MRKIILGVISLLSVTTYSQTKYEEMVSRKTCNCLSAIDSVTFDDFTQCLTASIAEDKDLLADELVKNNIELSRAGGYKFGKMISEKLGASMIFSCDKYYQIMKSGRETMRTSYNKDSLQTVLLELNNSPEDHRNSTFYRQRGVVYFLLANLPAAVSDFNNVAMEDKDILSTKPTTLQSMIFKAWALELQGSFDESIAIYDKLIMLTKRPELLIMRAITQREKSGKR